MRPVLKNKAQCLLCGDILESKHRHDFRRCSCGSMAVDGGREYSKRMGDPKNIREIYEEVGDE